MRLTDHQAQAIRQLARQAAGSQTRVRVFGSRLDDAAHGGGIDLMLEVPEPVDNPAQMSAQVSRVMHGRKVDVLLSAPNLMRLPIHDSGTENRTAPAVFNSGRAQRMQTPHHHRPAPVWRPLYPGASYPTRRRRPRPDRAGEAFVGRFGRLQDTVGDKLLPLLLAALGEKPIAAIDNLDRAERLELLKSADEWMTMRNLRNQMVHEYVDDSVVLRSALQTGHAFVPALIDSTNKMIAEI